MCCDSSLTTVLVLLCAFPFSEIFSFPCGAVHVDAMIENSCPHRAFRPALRGCLSWTSLHRDRPATAHRANGRLGGRGGARAQPARVHPHPQDRRPGDRGVGPAPRPRLGRLPAQGGRSELAGAPGQVWQLHEGLLELSHSTGRVGSRADAALRRRRPDLLRRSPPVREGRLRVPMAGQVDAVLARLHRSRVKRARVPSSAPAPPQRAPGGSGPLRGTQGEQQAGPVGAQPLPYALKPAAADAAESSCRWPCRHGSQPERVHRARLYQWH